MNRRRKEKESEDGAGLIEEFILNMFAEKITSRCEIALADKWQCPRHCSFYFSAMVVGNFVIILT